MMRSYYQWSGGGKSGDGGQGAIFSKTTVKRSRNLDIGRKNVTHYSTFRLLLGLGFLTSLVKSSCYDDFSQLEDDIRTTTGNHVFSICPDTTFPIGYWQGYLRFWEPNITLQCGEDGSFANNCTFDGPGSSYGPSHLAITGYSDGAQIKGITFKNGKFPSVHCSRSAVFYDCIWENNGGTDRFSPNFRQVAVAGKREGKEVKFIGCSFINTMPSGRGAMFNAGSHVVIDNCIIKGTDGTEEGWGLSSRSSRYHFKTKFSISNSCFEDNFPGAVKVEDSTEIELNQNNYGTSNSQCNGIYYTIANRCEPFEATSCQQGPKLQPAPEAEPIDTATATAAELSTKFVRKQLKFKPCRWIAQFDNARRSNICGSRASARSKCARICSKEGCPRSSADGSFSSDECEKEWLKLYRHSKIKVKTCGWLQESRKKSKICKNLDAAVSACPTVCGSQG